MTPLEQRLVQQARERCQPLEPMPTSLKACLNPLPDIQAILFDIYGTLLISGSGDVGTAQEQSDQNAFMAALAEAGMACPEDLDGPAELMSTIHAVHHKRKSEGTAFPEVEIRDVWKETLLRNDMVAEPDAISVAVMAYELQTNPVWPMPGAMELLGELKKRGVRLGLVSNAQFYTPLILSALLGDVHDDLGFDPALCSWSYMLRESKPSPVLFEGVVSELHQGGIQPEQALYVGNDMLNDIYTASRAGLKTALFAGDQRSLRLRKEDARCAALEPDVVLAGLPGLLQILVG